MHYNVINAHWCRNYFVCLCSVLTMCSVQILAGCLIKLILLITLNNAVMLLEKYPYSKFFWSVFSRIRTEYGEIRTPYSLRIRENAEKKDSECGHFSRIVTGSYNLTPNFNCCLFVSVQYSRNFWNLLFWEPCEYKWKNKELRQNLSLILNEFKRIRQLPFPLKSSKNLRFSDYFRENRHYMIL